MQKVFYSWVALMQHHVWSMVSALGGTCGSSKKHRGNGTRVILQRRCVWLLLFVLLLLLLLLLVVLLLPPWAMCFEQTCWIIPALHFLAGLETVYGARARTLCLPTPTQASHEDVARVMCSRCWCLRWCSQWRVHTTQVAVPHRLRNLPRLAPEWQWTENMYGWLVC